MPTSLHPTETSRRPGALSPLRPARGGRRVRVVAFAGSALAAVAAALLAPPSLAAILPAWLIVGTADVQGETGIHDVTGTYELTISGQTRPLSLSYSESGALVGSAFFEPPEGFTIVGFRGVQKRLADGTESIVLEESVKRPRFRFMGAMVDGRDLVGTFTQTAGFAAFPDTASGDMTIPRDSPSVGNGRFRLFCKTTTDSKGHVKGGLSLDGVTEDLARMNLFAGRTVSGGKIRGRVRTNRLGETTGKVTILGPKWSVRLDGPLDADGFHASADVKAAGFDVKDVPFLLPVGKGADPPPPPPPPPPANQVSGGTATVSGGQVRILRFSVPKRFFGATASLDVQFPTSSGSAGSFHADPSNASTATPHRFIVKVGRTTYGTAAAPADVAVEVQKFEAFTGGEIRLLCTGKVATASGKTKNVDVLLVALVE